MNEYKVLIVAKEKNIQEVLKEKFDFKIFQSTIQKESLEIAKDELVNLIIIDIDENNSIEMIEKLKEDVATEDIPIVIVTSFDYETIKEKIGFIDIKDIIFKPISKERVVKSIKSILRQENKFMGSYTNRYVKSSVSFYSSQLIASEMIAILEVISRELLIPAQKKLDMKSTLAILSTTIKNQMLNKTIQLFKDMRFAKDIVHLLRSVQSPKTLYEQVIYLIYEFKKAEFNQEDINSVNVDSINEKVLTLVKDIIKNSTTVVKSKVGFDLVLNRLIEILINDTKVEKTLADEFLYYAKDRLKKLVKENSESVAKIVDSESSLKFIMSFEKYLNSEALLKEIENKNIDIKVEKINSEKYLAITLNKNIKESSNYEQTLLKKSILDTTISATEYITSLNIDISDDLYDMEEIEREWENRVIALETSRSIYSLKELSETIHIYASKINNIFYEFEAIGYALVSLSQTMSRDDIDTNSLENVAIFLENLIHDIEKWRESIFINSDAHNIHYLDNSLLSSCMQIESMLTNEEIESEDDIEFF